MILNRSDLFLFAVVLQQVFPSELRAKLRVHFAKTFSLHRPISDDTSLSSSSSSFSHLRTLKLRPQVELSSVQRCQVSGWGRKMALKARSLTISL